jgi:hypothetical protein
VTHAGWYARRRGILEHLESGKITVVDSGIHDYLCLIADHKTGVCRASAEKIHVLAGAGVSLRAIQRSLAKLEEIGWIKRFLVPGRRGNYHIAIARFFVREASGTWLSVNLERTNDWRLVQFDAVTDPSFIRQGPVSEVSPIQEVEELEEIHKDSKTVRTSRAKARHPRKDFKNLKTKGSVTQESDTRFQSIKEQFETEFSSRNPGVAAPFDGGDGKALKALLKTQSHATTETLISWLQNAFNSEGDYPLLPGFRLREFCAHATKFTCGPLKKAGSRRAMSNLQPDSESIARIKRLVR